MFSAFFSNLSFYWDCCFFFPRLHCQFIDINISGECSKKIANSCLFLKKGFAELKIWLFCVEDMCWGSCMVVRFCKWAFCESRIARGGLFDCLFDCYKDQPKQKVKDGRPKENRATNQVLQRKNPRKKGKWFWIVCFYLKLKKKSIYTFQRGMEREWKDFRSK